MLFLNHACFLFALSSFITVASAEEIDYNVAALPITTPESVGNEYLTAGSSYCGQFSDNNYLSIKPSCQCDGSAALYEGIVNVTYAAWIKPDPIASHTPVIGFVSGGPQMYLSKNAAGKVFLNSKNDWVENAGKTCTPLGHPTVPDLNDGEWHHVAMTLDQDNLRLYVDGEVYEMCTFDHTANTWVSSDTIGTEIRVGGNIFNSHYNGLIDEVRIYARYLEPNEIGLIYKYSTIISEDNVELHNQYMIAAISFATQDKDSFVPDYINSDLEVKVMEEKQTLAKIVPATTPVCGTLLSGNIRTKNLDSASVYEPSFSACALMHEQTSGTGSYESSRFGLQNIRIKTISFIYDNNVAGSDSLVLGILESSTLGNVSLTPSLTDLVLTNEVSFKFHPSQLIGSLSLTLELSHATSYTENITMEIAMTENTRPQIGTSGYALNCDGVDDYLFSPTFELQTGWFKKDNGDNVYGAGAVTVEGWVFLEKGSGGVFFTVGNGEQAASWVDTFSPFRKMGRFLLFMPDQNDLFGAHVGSLSIMEKDISEYYDTWVHFAFAHEQASGDQSYLYLNGVLVEQKQHDYKSMATNVTIDWQKTPFGPLKILKTLSLCTSTFWSDSYHKGQVDELRIWSGIRSQQQIIASMNNRLTGKESSLLGYWNFDDQDQYLAKDSSKYNNDLIGGGCAPCEDYYMGYSQTRFTKTKDEESSKVCLPSAQSSASPNFERELVFGGFHCYGEKNVNINAVPERIISGAPLAGFIHVQNTVSETPIDIQLNFTDADGDDIEFTFVKTVEYGTLSYMDGVTLTPIKDGDKIDSLSEVKFTPSASFGGTTQFSIFISDAVSHSATVSIEIVTKCLPGNFFDSLNMKCVACPVGSYNDMKSLNEECILCPENTFTDITGQTRCNYCPENSFSAMGQEKCSSCSDSPSGMDISFDGRCPTTTIFENEESSTFKISSIATKENGMLHNGTRALVTSYPQFGDLLDDGSRSYRPGFLLTKTTELFVSEIVDVTHNISSEVYTCISTSATNDVCRTTEEYLLNKDYDPRGILGNPLTTDTQWLAKSATPVVITFKVATPMFISDMFIHQKRRGAIVAIHALKTDANEWDILWLKSTGNSGEGTFNPKICPTYYKADTFKVTLNTTLVDGVSDITAIRMLGAETLDAMPMNLVTNENWNVYYTPSLIGKSRDSFGIQIMQCIDQPKYESFLSATLSSDVIPETYSLPDAYRYCLIGFVSLIIALLIFTLVLMVYYRDEKRLKRASPLFLCICIIGTIFAFSTLYFDSFEASQGTCIAREVLSVLGFALAWGSILVIVFRIKIIFTTAAGKMDTNSQIEDIYLFRDLAFLVLFFAVYIGIWFGVSTPEAVTKYEDSYQFKVCETSPWYYGLIGIEYLLMFIVGIVAYQIRHCPRDFNECKAITISVYIWIILSIIPVIVDLFVSNLLAASIISVLQLCFVYLPMIGMIIIYKIVLMHSRDETKKQTFSFVSKKSHHSGSDSNRKTNNTSRTKKASCSQDEMYNASHASLTTTIQDKSTKAVDMSVYDGPESDCEVLVVDMATSHVSLTQGETANLESSSVYDGPNTQPDIMVVDMQTQVVAETTA